MEKVALVMAAPFIIQTTLVSAAIVAVTKLPIRTGVFVKDKMKNMYIKYKENKQEYARKRIIKPFEKVTEESIYEELMRKAIEQVEERVSSFFDDEIPKKIQERRQHIKRLQTDSREPTEIQQQNRSIRNIVMSIYGKVLMVSRMFFDSNLLYVQEIKNRGILGFNQ